MTRCIGLDSYDFMQLHRPGRLEDDTQKKIYITIYVHDAIWIEHDF